MLFALLCTDKPGGLQLRLDTRPDHLAYLDHLNARGILKIAGPFLGADGKPTGSLVIVKTETLEEAKAIAAADPYAKAGLFSNVEIKAYNWVFNNPEA
ncbi:YciI-like protein [Sinorhizobium terangae]|uniref:YciI-like protein n=1 Tax=Sinorhizobium terangae TaxID=110322 RepID=UPI0024B0FC06|nr:YciI-like protein [Sinorhizobium terangae]WFU47277.1 YciI-like protein [Sinorhizobium terangae]